MKIFHFLLSWPSETLSALPFILLERSERLVLATEGVYDLVTLFSSLTWNRNILQVPN